jgi:hypothetical protein
LTHNELKQIIHLKSEIAMLMRRKHKSSQFMSDYGYDHRGGGREVITIQGYNAPMHYEAVELLESRAEELKSMVTAAEKYIAEVPDARIRVILTMRYLDGKPWHDVAKAIYKNMTADSVRKCAARWFEKNKK